MVGHFSAIYKQISHNLKWSCGASEWAQLQIRIFVFVQHICFLFRCVSVCVLRNISFFHIYFLILFIILMKKNLCVNWMAIFFFFLIFQSLLNYKKETINKLKMSTHFIASGIKRSRMLIARNFSSDEIKKKMRHFTLFEVCVVTWLRQP